MKYYQVAVNRPVHRCFTYSYQEREINLGCLVKVPYGRQTLYGVVIEVTEVKPNFAIKPIQEILEQVFLEKELKALIWLAKYYVLPIGQAVFMALPKNLASISAYQTNIAPSIKQAQTPPTLNVEQEKVCKEILAYSEQFHVSVLHGITGSGKTRIYIELIKNILKQGRSILILIPEIGLCNQVYQEFSKFIDQPIAVLNSVLTGKQQIITYKMIMSGHYQIVIGTRMAAFSQLPNLGLIIIDEEHDHSFKQQDGLRYNARDFAIKKAQFYNKLCVVGSATPKVETYKKITAKYYSYHYINTRVNNYSLPELVIAKLDQSNAEIGLTNTLIQAITDNIKNHKQTLLYLNRRGFAPISHCSKCGYIQHCENCSVAMIVHKNENKLLCHQCGFKFQLTTNCSQCKASAIQFIGHGTQRVFANLSKIFPEANILRLDRDSIKTKTDFAQQISEAKQGKYEILIGTQLLSKGHHIPGISLVGILNFDHFLHSADFRSQENMLQNFFQVSGRAGRTGSQSKVILQTTWPEHNYIKYLFCNNYQQHLDRMLNERSKYNFPPYKKECHLIGSHTNEKLLNSSLKKVRASIPNIDGINCIGPMPSQIPKKAQKYYAGILIEYKCKEKLNNILSEILKKTYTIKLSIDIDPICVI